MTTGGAALRFGTANDISRHATLAALLSTTECRARRIEVSGSIIYPTVVSFVVRILNPVSWTASAKPKPGTQRLTPVIGPINVSYQHACGICHFRLLFLGKR